MNYIIYLIDQKLGNSYSAKIYVNLTKVAVVNSVYKNQNQITLSLNSSNNSNQSEVISGGWDLFTNYSDQRYIDSKNVLLYAYPQLNNYSQTKV